MNSSQLHKTQIGNSTIIYVRVWLLGETPCRLL